MLSYATTNLLMNVNLWQSYSAETVNRFKNLRTVTDGHINFTDKTDYIYKKSRKTWFLLRELNDCRLSEKKIAMYVYIWQFFNLVMLNGSLNVRKKLNFNLQYISG